MPVAVTRTKIILPRRRAELLTRPRLIEQLEGLLDFKLIILAAPAGYGKTSLLIDFAHQTELPVCWYGLDSLDRDPQRFIAHLIASLAQRFPAFGKQALAAFNSTNPAGLDPDALATAIVNDAFENIREHFLLILDDYHLVSDNQEIDSFISRFVQDVDENCHLILSSRALLTLPDMPLLVARSQVDGLSFEELAFRPAEIKSLVLQNYHVSMPDQAAEELAVETEGWITGLLLSAQTMWQGMADRLRVARVSGVGLYDYLAQQVLDQQPPTLRTFLLQTSLLEEFDLELCESVFGSNPEWPSLIGSILQHNLFILPVGEDGRWIRYHHLFRDFLQNRLEQEQPDLKDHILRRLVEVYAGRSDWEKAYATTQRLNDLWATAELIEQAGPALIKSGRPRILIEWIEELPADLLKSRPALLSLDGAAAVIQGRVEPGLLLLNQAEQALRAAGEITALARTLVRRAIAHQHLGHYQACLDDARQALALSEPIPELRSVQAEATKAIGACLSLMGQVNAATEELERALELYTALDDRSNIAMVLLDLGMADVSAGRYSQAMRRYKKALHYWRETGNIVGQATLLNNLGVLNHLTGDYQQAAMLFEEALAHAQKNTYTRMEAYILCSIGDLYADLDASEPALNAYRQAREAGQRADDRFLLLYVDLAEAAEARRSGAPAQAGRFLANAEQLVRLGDSTYEQGLFQLESGRLSLAYGDAFVARRQLEIATRSFEEGGQRVEAARAHLLLAAACLRTGDQGAVQAGLTQAVRLTSGLESQHVLVLAARDAKPVLEAVQGNPETSRAADRLARQIAEFEAGIPALRRRLRGHAKAVPFAPPRLTIQAFGRSLVEVDGKPVNVPEWQNQRKAREFFFCLLAHPDGLTKEAIGLFFWPDSSSSQLKLQFKNTIYRLRRALGQDIILFDEDRYWFNRSIDYGYDVEIFLAKLTEGRSATSPQAKITAFLAARALYKGAYLPEVDGSWALIERESLRQKYIEAMLELAQLHREAKEYGFALEECQLVLTEDPCLEEAYCLAMLVYADRGDKAAIARQYERCCQALQEEMHITPSRETRRLYEELKAQD
ncbi:MAG TPA: BTAD domain-containing putative transcriptional regulator [Anaerolineales bacterium]